MPACCAASAASPAAACMKAHIGVDAESGLVHTVKGIAGNVNDVVEASVLLHGQEAEVFGDAGDQGADKRADAPADV
jgi:IS5 family transposase